MAIKPGTPHPTKRGLVMGNNKRYVAKGTYNKQKANASKPATKPASQKPKVQTKSSPSTPKVGATKRLQGRMVRWNGKRWTAAGTGPKQPAPTPRKADATPKPPTGNFKAPKIPTPKTSPSTASTASKVVRGAGKVLRGAGKVAGGAGLVAGGLSTANDLRKSLQRGEGYAALSKLSREANKGNTGRSGAQRRAALRVQPESTPSKTTSGQRTNRRGRVIGSNQPSVKPARRGMSNIPTKEGTGKGSPNDRKPTTTSSTPKTSTSTSKPKTDTRSTLTKEIDGLTKFIATHKDKTGMARGVAQARKRLAEKKKKKGQRSTTMSGNTLGTSSGTT